MLSVSSVNAPSANRVFDEAFSFFASGEYFSLDGLLPDFEAFSFFEPAPESVSYYSVVTEDYPWRPTRELRFVGHLDGLLECHPYVKKVLKKNHPFVWKKKGVVYHNDPPFLSSGYDTFLVYTEHCEEHTFLLFAQVAFQTLVFFSFVSASSNVKPNDLVLPTFDDMEDAFSEFESRYTHPRGVESLKQAFGVPALFL